MSANYTPVRQKVSETKRNNGATVSINTPTSPDKRMHAAYSKVSE